MNVSGGSTTIASIGRPGATSAEINKGVLFVLVASLLSGLSAALTQRALVAANGRHSLFYSAELALYGIVFLVFHAVLGGTRDRHAMLSGHLFDNWDLQVLVPVVANVRVAIVVLYVCHRMHSSGLID